MKMSKFKAIKAEIKNLPGYKQEIAEQLLDKVVFIDEQLHSLQEALKEKGWVETYQNGASQFGLKKSSEGEVYNSLVKNYSTIMKQLNDLLPDQAEPDDELLSFLGNK